MKIGNVKRKLLISLSGTALAQIIHLLFTPILTRVYTPEEFGELAILIAFGGIVTAVATARYDVAIVVATEEERVVLDKGIIKISYFVGLFLILIALIIFYMGKNNYGILCFFLAFIAIIRANYQSKRSILNSYGKYSQMANGRVVENTSNGVIAFALSFFQVGSIGLMLAKTLSYLIPVKYYSSITKKLVPQSLEVGTSETLKKFIKFPKYSIASSLIDQINLGFSIFAFTYLYGEAIAGHVSMTTRVLSLPINFIGVAFLDVFREKATKDYLKFGNFKTIFIKFFLSLAFLAVLGFAIITTLGEPIFILVLGEQWETAGQFATIAIALYSVRLISSPLTFSFQLNQNQQAHMLFEVLILFVSLAAVSFSFIKELPPMECLQIYCYSLASVHLLFIYAAYKNSSKTKFL
ncbi:MAG: hypothetical protein CME65_04435 [Halobacteriovoraceae bacterium]|nr:hypothetical protein [Halobacteriovoraceae bacterium]|tara:strand:+ start:1398 stop:2627 length:1230 start_codon:yes stop_codon:yes gene_type:complete